MSFRKGYHAELELIALLSKKGFHALRVPVSGGRGFPCDVLAAKGEDKRAYEVKQTKKEALYLYEKDIQPLLNFCQNFSFQAYVAVRWKFKKKTPWTFLKLDEIRPLKIVRNVK